MDTTRKTYRDLGTAIAALMIIRDGNLPRNITVREYAAAILQKINVEKQEKKNEQTENRQN